MMIMIGNIVYFGPAQKAVDYFSRLNFDCPKYANPADYLCKYPRNYYYSSY